MTAITWGVTRTPDGPRCSVFCHVCREVFGRDLCVTEARELREAALALHTEGVCKKAEGGGRRNWNLGCKHPVAPDGRRPM